MSYQCFPALPGSPSNATSLKQLGRGQPEPWTRSPKAVFWVIIFLQIMVQAWGLGTISDE